MDVPPVLINEIRQGRVVLFFGSGGSKGAIDKNGNEAPDGEQLRQLLARRFLGRPPKDGESLAWIAELAISETDIGTVQDFIRDLLMGLEPAQFHLKIPMFQWRGIFSTNYDLVLEKSYSAVSKRVQEVIPLITNNDRLDDKLRSAANVALVKLHGCITRTHDERTPLILTTDQYGTHRENRDRLFRLFDEWGHEYSIVFLGHGMQDSDMRIALLELGKLGAFRPRYYLVRPNVDALERRLWESKRITVLDGTLEQFMEAIDSGVPASFRQIIAPASTGHPITHRFASSATMSREVADSLATDLEYVHSSIQVASSNPKAFYKGFDLGWFGIVANLDVRRRLTDEILFDWLLISDSDRPTPIELFVVKAAAGAGKSILLRRLAWELGVEGEQLVLFMRGQGHLRYEPLRELANLTKQRLFVFVDNSADHVSELLEIIRRARSDAIPLTIITAERVNTWNVACDRLEPYLTDGFELTNLSRAEIEQLVDLLETHGSLGYLEKVNRDERIAAFTERAGRQLLVALHEATSGRPFEDILVDEYNEIRPREAKALYLTVCVLNRLDIPVRAGIIARIHGIPFVEFRERFLGPLEHVVGVQENLATRDFFYVARHPEIAGIVFDRILTSPSERYNEYVSLVGALNLAYSTDVRAFRSLVRARALMELFPDHDAVRGIFEAAGRLVGEDGYLLQQLGIYEMLRPNGSYNEAQRLLGEARKRNPRDTSIVHSMAELARIQSEHAETEVSRERYRLEAEKLAQSLLTDESSKEHALHTLIKVELQELKALLQRGNTPEQHIDRLVEKVESYLDTAVQEFPDSSYLLASEADFGALVNDDARALAALERAFAANRRNSYIGIRLARIYENRNDRTKAGLTLKAALDAKPGDKGLHYRYAMLLMQSGTADRDALVYHFRRAFTQWDTNYEAQFWLGRYTYESSNEDERRLSKEVFTRLRNAPVKHDTRVRIRSSLEDRGQQRIFTGTIVRRQETNGFVELDGRGDWLFIHRNDQKATAWDMLTIGKRVSLRIGFALAGPRGLDLEMT